jgi:hypothetical protein
MAKTGERGIGGAVADRQLGRRTEEWPQNMRHACGARIRFVRAVFPSKINIDRFSNGRRPPFSIVFAIAPKLKTIWRFGDLRIFQKCARNPP